MIKDDTVLVQPTGTKYVTDHTFDRFE